MKCQTLLLILLVIPLALSQEKVTIVGSRHEKTDAVAVPRTNRLWRWTDGSSDSHSYRSTVSR